SRFAQFGAFTYKLKVCRAIEHCFSLPNETAMCLSLYVSASLPH
ncbi:hypothetical protein P781_16115, partial [Vibrio mimicus CAIM 1883]